MKISPEERFWAKVDRRGPDECWLWTAGTTRGGYGNFWDGNRYARAHRYSYLLNVGPIPDGLDLDHVKARGCSSRLCVNPAHLEPVSRGQNTLRGDHPCAIAFRESVCLKGHPYTDASTAVRIVNGRVHRQCRICLYAYMNERKRRRIATEPGYADRLRQQKTEAQRKRRQRYQAEKQATMQA